MPLVAIIWFALCLIWGSTWIVIKIGLNNLPPLGFAASRFTLAIVVLFAILRIRRIPLPTTGAEWRLLALTGVLQFSINYSLVFWAEQHISSGLTAIMQATISIFGLLLAWIFLPQEKITGTRILAVALGIVGVATIFSDQLTAQSGLAFLACVGVLVSAYTASQAAILIKAKAGTMHPAALLFGQMVCGLAPILVYSLIAEGNPLNYHWTWSAVASVLYLAIAGTIIAFWLFYWLLAKVESTFPMMISVVTPLIAVLLGWLFLDEHLPPQTLTGGMLIIASVALTILRR